MGAGAWGLISVTWKGKSEEKRVTMVPCSQEELSSVKAVWHNKLLYVHVPFVVHCCRHVWAVLPNSPCPSGTLVGNLLREQDISNGLLLVVNGSSPLFGEDYKDRRERVWGG